VSSAKSVTACKVSRSVCARSGAREGLSLAGAGAKAMVGLGRACGSSGSSSVRRFFFGGPFVGSAEIAATGLLRVEGSVMAWRAVPLGTFDARSRAIAGDEPGGGGRTSGATDDAADAMLTDAGAGADAEGAAAGFE